MGLRNVRSRSVASRDSISAASCSVGRLKLNRLVMPAAGTYGLSNELASYGDYPRLGAFVTKSLSPNAWAGNSGGNLAPVRGGGMLNSVGLKNPGTSEWVRSHAPQLEGCGTPVVVSIWGLSKLEVGQAASDLADCPTVSAVEVNLSCPNVEDPRLVVSHDPRRVRGYIAETVAGLGVNAIPVFAKLAPSTPDLIGCARAAQEAGAEGVTLVNTMSGMAVDLTTLAPTLSGVFGGLSGRPLHPVALRAIFQVRSAIPELPIIGVGGVADAQSALELIAVGASAVQVGTACFNDPRAPYRIADDVDAWLRRRGVAAEDLSGAITSTSRPDEFGQLFQELIPAPSPPTGREVAQAARTLPTTPRKRRRVLDRAVRDRPEY